MEDDEQLCTAYNSSYYQDNIEVLRKKARDRYRKRKYPPSAICVCGRHVPVISRMSEANKPTFTQKQTVLSFD